VKKRSLTIHGHRTSISLEEPFWAALNDIAKALQMSVASLVQMIDKERSGGLSSAIRIFVLAELRHKLAASATTQDTQIF
jgi:predicted DNA-binding ribbon-helix-helix protein